MTFQLPTPQSEKCKTCQFCGSNGDLTVSIVGELYGKRITYCKACVYLGDYALYSLRSQNDTWRASVEPQNEPFFKSLGFTPDGTYSVRSDEKTITSGWQLAAFDPDDTVCCPNYNPWSVIDGRVVVFKRKECDVHKRRILLIAFVNLHELAELNPGVINANAYDILKRTITSLVEDAKAKLLKQFPDMLLGLSDAAANS
jgi:hypothetical protein